MAKGKTHLEYLESGAGPLRVRRVPVHSYGKCHSCHMEDDLYDWLCKFCLWMTNDDEADPKFNHVRGRDPLTFTG